jgi:hypothetical protein
LVAQPPAPRLETAGNATEYVIVQESHSIPLCLEQRIDEGRDRRAQGKNDEDRDSQKHQNYGHCPPPFVLEHKRYELCGDSQTTLRNVNNVHDCLLPPMIQLFPPKTEQTEAHLTWLIETTIYWNVKIR